MIATQKHPLPGTRPEGARDEREAAARVRLKGAMFVGRSFSCDIALDKERRF